MNEHILLANEKIAQLSAEMQRQDFDAFLILSRQGSDGYFELLFDQTTEHLCAALFRQSGAHALLVHSSEAEKFARLTDVTIQTYTEDFASAFTALMDAQPITRLALDYSEDDTSADGLTLGAFTYVFRYFHLPMEELEQKVTSAAEMMDTVRALKSPIELQRLRESIALAEECIAVCRDEIQQGMTELEISDLFVREMKKRGLVSSEGGGPDTPPMLLNLRGGMSHRGPLAKLMPIS